MDKKLDKRTKWSYSIGAAGRDAAYALVSMYLMTYIQYTMQLSVAQFSVISLIVVLCLVWDAFNDPLMGIIIENTHFKWGKFKPWILLGAVLNALVIVALFLIRPTGWGFVAFFGVFYLLWGMTYTMNDIAYWGMLPSLTSDKKERDSLVTIMSIFVCIGQFLVAGIVPTVIAGNAINAFRVVALIVALCLILFQALVAFGTKESKREDNQEKITLKDMFKIFIRNDQLVPIGIACFLFNIGSNLLIVFGTNFFFFEFGYTSGGDMIFLFTVMYGLGTLLSQAFYSLLCKKFSRSTLLNISMIALAVCYVLFMGIGYLPFLPKDAILLNAIGFFIFFFQGLYNLVTVVMLNNTIEYDEYKHNERHDSVISAIRSFSVKLAGAINQGIVVLVLVVSGIYTISQNISSLEIEVAKETITQQEAVTQADAFIAGTGSTELLILRICMVIIPLITMGAAYLLIKRKYKIDEKRYEEIVNEISARKTNEE